jgi:sterol desaturase/sphingolipid hydroxylase (fatty acid hydroxylase superfamily)
MVATLILSLLFVAVAALERVPAFRRVPARLVRPHLATDVAWYGVATAAGLVSTIVFRPQLAKLAVIDVEAFPWAARLAVAVVVYDLVAFAVHVAIHRSDALWSVHKVHHSSLQLDWLATTRTHMFEHLVRNVPAQAVLFAMGMSADIVVAALLIYAAFAVHGHSNLCIAPRWMESVFVTPRLHHLHHLPATTERNFGTILTVWDRALGRFVDHEAPAGARTGVPGEVDAYPQRFVDAARQPLREARARRVALAATARP